MRTISDDAVFTESRTIHPQSFYMGCVALPFGRMFALMKSLPEDRTSELRKGAQQPMQPPTAKT